MTIIECLWKHGCSVEHQETSDSTSQCDRVVDELVTKYVGRILRVRVRKAVGIFSEEIGGEDIGEAEAAGRQVRPRGDLLYLHGRVDRKQKR